MVSTMRLVIYADVIIHSTFITFHQHIVCDWILYWYYMLVILCVSSSIAEHDGATVWGLADGFLKLGLQYLRLCYHLYYFQVSSSITVSGYLINISWMIEYPFVPVSLVLIRYLCNIPVTNTITHYSPSLRCGLHCCSCSCNLRYCCRCFHA